MSLHSSVLFCTKHIKCSPYHPSNNRLAERAVQTVKAGLKKTHDNLEDRLYGFLTRYRVTPQSTTGQTPSYFVLKTPPRTGFDLLRPCVRDRVLQKQAYENQTRRSCCRSYARGTRQLLGSKVLMETQVDPDRIRKPTGSTYVYGTSV